jgi:hypothetical protein
MKLMLVPSSGVAATRFVSSNATLSVGDVFYNKAGLTVSYTGSYSTSGLLVSASQNIQLGGAGVTSVFTQSNMNLSSFSYQFNAIENTTYYARYYVVDVNNSVVYSNEVTFTTPVKPALTVTNVVNDGNGNTVVTYNYVGQSLPFAFKKSIQSAFWSTTAEQEDVTITPQSGNGLTLSISGYTVREGLFVRVVDLVNAEYVSATYQVPSLYNNVVSVTGVTANNNELSVSYNVSGAFTGYNNSLTNPSMYVQYRIGSGVFNDYTLVQNKLAAASTGNTIVGYNGVLLLSAGTNVSFRFKIVDANGGYILSNVFVYSLSATHKSISVIPNRSAVTSTIFIDPATTVLLQGFGIGDNINRRVYLPFKNELDNAYYIVPVNPIMLEIDPPTPSALFMTYQDIPNANTLFVTASAMANQAVSVIYDEVSDKFKYNQTINGVVQAVVVERLPLAPPYDVFMWADDRVGNQLTIYYESSIASTVTIERFRNNGWDVIATTQLEISDDTSLTVTIPQAILDQSQVMDVLVFRLTDSSLTIKSCFPVINM